MAITASIIAKDLAQPSGRRWIREDHTDHLGAVYERWYSAPDAGFDVTARLAANAIVLAAELAKAEIDKNVAEVIALGSLAVYTFAHSTVSQNAAALRAAYLVSTKIEAVMMGDALSILTNGQLQTAFGLTAGQVTTLRANKLTPAANLAASIRAITGNGS